MAKKASLGNLVRVVSANMKVRNWFERFYNIVEDQVLLTQQNVNA